MPISFEGLLDESEAGRATPKYEQVRARLMNEIAAGRLRPGDMLPPEPVMAEQMKVARSTVRQALAQLEHIGIVRRVRGKGTFIHQDAHLRTRSGLDAFALILPNPQRGYYPSLLAGFEAAAAAVRSQVIVINTHNNSHRQADGILQLIDKKVAGAAIVPAMSPPTPAYQIRQLQQHQIPVVLCHRGIDGVRAPLLAFNGDDVGRLAAEAMLKAGHRHAALISTWRTELAQRFEAGLRNTLHAAGASLDPDSVVYVEADGDTNPADYESRMEKAIDDLVSRKRPPTAIFVTFDDVAELIYLHLIRRSIRVPDDVSLISFGGITRLGAMQQMMTAVTVDEMQLGKYAAELLEEMRRGKRPIEADDRREIPLAISKGQTLKVQS
jgi:DNA-binding LacI/PurR family transcriptional regulator